MNETSSLYDLLCVGSTALDILLRTPRLPALGEKQVVEFAGRMPSGLTANTACAAARLGLTTAWYGLLGDDDFGRLLQDSFKPFGVDTRFSRVQTGTSSDFNTVLLTPEGEHTTLVANTMPSPPPLAPIRELLCRMPLVYTLPYQLEWFHELTDLVHTCRGLVAVDIETSAAIQSMDLRRAMEWADIAFLSRSGLRKHVGTSDVLSAGRTVLSWGPRVVVITLGKDGAFACTEGNVQYSPALPARPVDTNGSAESFQASFLYAIRQKWPLDASLRFSNAAAALTTQALGARTGFPDRVTVEAFIKENPLVTTDDFTA